MSGAATIQISGRVRALALVLIVLGAATAIVGVILAPERTWPNLLVDFSYLATVGVSALFFMAAQSLTGARWSASLRRVPEAFTAILPVGALLVIIAVFFGRSVLYPWSHPGGLAHEPAFAGKNQYLQPSWVFIRMIIVLASWLIFAGLFRRASLHQDQHPELGLAQHKKLTLYSTLFLPLFAVTLTIAAFDWILSMDPRWFSTMYAVYVFAGTFVQGIAAITLATIALKKHGALSAQHCADHQIHDLGKMLFAFSTFWAYIWTCQYLLIWYGNIPDEVTHYVSRTNGPWLYLFALNLIVNWLVPFTVLLSVRAKRTTNVLRAMCILVLFGHWLDLYMLVAPTVWTTPKLGIPEIAIAAGCCALLFLVVVRGLNQASVVPLNDPILAYESAHVIVHHHPVQRNLGGVEQ